KEIGNIVESIKTASDNKKPYHLVITHWGHEGARRGTGPTIPVAEYLILEMRDRDLRVPVLIFGGNTHVRHRKEKAHGLGAQGYYYSYGGILRGIERVLTEDGESL